MNLFIALQIVWVAVASCGLLSSPASAQSFKSFATADYKVNVFTVVEGLENPWSLAFIPDGRMLVTERRGTLRVIDKGRLIEKPVSGLPRVAVHGQGGLMDVALHPKYAENRWIYWTYNASVGDLHGTELARGKLGGSANAPAMTDVQVLFKMVPKTDRAYHFGSRIVFDREGFLYLTLGDRGDNPGKGATQRAQLLSDHAGKTIRLMDDGRVPTDNPFLQTPGAKPEIFSLGHRNIQGAAIHPASGRLWAHEHGPQGGDEVNILVAGANYGWPVVTHGVNYVIGTKIGEGAEKPGMKPSLLHWTPSIAPSGMVFVGSDGNGGARPTHFPKWSGNVMAGALAGQMLVRMTLSGDQVVAQERMLIKALGRIRDVRNGPDGYLYVLTDSVEGALLRMEPAP